MPTFDVPSLPQKQEKDQVYSNLKSMYKIEEVDISVFHSDRSLVISCNFFHFVTIILVFNVWEKKTFQVNWNFDNILYHYNHWNEWKLSILHRCSSEQREKTDNISLFRKVGCLQFGVFNLYPKLEIVIYTVVYHCWGV